MLGDGPAFENAPGGPAATKSTYVDWDSARTGGAAASPGKHLGGAAWSGWSLAGHAAAWRADGAAVLRAQVWLLYARAWTGLALFAALATLRVGLDDAAALLLTLPLAAATRWRALLALVLAGELGTALLLGAAALAPLVVVLGAEGAAWLALGMIGGAAPPACAAAAGMTCRRLRPRPSGRAADASHP